MPTTPLRGSGFHPTSPAPYGQLRSQNENKAQLILDAKKDRETKEKDRERVLKEADRALKQKFDSAKTEATLHGLPQGQASVMSLGQLEGWVKATREIKVNEQQMLEMEERRERLDQMRRAEEQKNQARKDQENALRLVNFINRDTSKTDWNEENVQGLATLLGMKKSSSLMNAYYGMRQKMRSQGPLRVDSVQVPGRWARANVIQGGGMPPTMLPPKAPAFDPNDVVIRDGLAIIPPGVDAKVMPVHGGGASGSSHIQLTTRPDGSQVLVDKSKGTVTPVPGGEAPPSAWKSTDIEMLKARNDEIRGEMEAMRKEPQGVRVSPAWGTKMQSLTNEFKENNKIISGYRPPKSQPQPQAQAPAPATPAPVKYDDYFDAQGVPNQQMKDLLIGDPAGVVRVLRQLEKQGDLTKEQVRNFLATIK